MLLQRPVDANIFLEKKHRTLSLLDETANRFAVSKDLILSERRFWTRYLRHCKVGASWRRKSKYKISAIVSTYNSAEFIETCLSDICGQSVSEFVEIIVVDACSPESEWSFVEKFRKGRPNIVNVRAPQRIGIYPAWNLAISLARGDYVTTCSTNDRLNHTAHETLMRELDADAELALVYGDSHVTDLPHQSTTDFVQAAEDSHFLTWGDYDYEELLVNCGVGPHPMWRRQLHTELGFFDCRYESLADQDFWLRIGWNHKMKHVPEFTGLFWKTPAGISQRLGAATEIQMIHEKYKVFRSRGTPPSLGGEKK